MKKALVLLGVIASILPAFADNEITAASTLAVRKGYLQLSISERMTVTMTGESFDHRSSAVTTNPAALVVSADIGEPGVALFKNVSTNHTIYLGVTDESPFLKLGAGEMWQGRLATNAISHYCDTLYYAAWTNISGGVTNAYPASTNVAAVLESIIVED